MNHKDAFAGVCDKKVGITQRAIRSLYQQFHEMDALEKLGDAYKFSLSFYIVTKIK